VKRDLLRYHKIQLENPVVVDDCQLTTTTRRSLPVDTGTLDFALLNNSDFSLVDANGQPLYWSIGCDGSSLVDDSLELRDGACADQSFSDSDIGSFVEFKHIAYRCALKNVSGYSDMSIFFDGELQKSVEITESEIGSFVGFIFELEHMPLNGFASLYTEGVLEVDDCVMFFV